MAISHLKSVLDDSSDFGETSGRDIVHDTINTTIGFATVRNHVHRHKHEDLKSCPKDGTDFVGFWGILRPLSCRFSGLTPDLFWDFKSGPRWSFYSERRIRSICPVAIRQKNEAGSYRSYHEIFRVSLGFQLPLSLQYAGRKAILGGRIICAFEESCRS